jgi:hypothetical protein
MNVKQFCLGESCFASVYLFVVAGVVLTIFLTIGVTLMRKKQKKYFDAHGLDLEAGTMRAPPQPVASVPPPYPMSRMQTIPLTDSDALPPYKP